MKRAVGCSLLLAALVLALPAIVTAQEKPSIEGRWDITFEDGGSTPVSVEFTTKEGRLTGTFYTTNGPVALDRVQLEGNELTFSYSGLTSGALIVFQATVRDDRMDGTSYFADVASQSFTAVRRKN